MYLTALPIIGTYIGFDWVLESKIKYIICA